MMALGFFRFGKSCGLTARNGQSSRELLLLLILILPLLTSCFTGVEGTKRVALGKEDRQRVKPTEEEQLLAQVKGVPLGEWKAGKKFLATDDRLQYALEKRGDRSARESLKGKEMSFTGTDTRIMPDGSAQTSVLLTDGSSTYSYSTGLSKDLAPSQFTSDRLPMLIDLDMVARADSILKGRKVWIRTSMWYTSDTVKYRGRKFIPVDITGTSTGDTTFPLRVSFRDPTGKEAFVYMNFGSTGFDSRSFANLFSLSDLRKRYNSITDENWERICSGLVAPGMTKEECRLALGQPDDVDVGRTYSQTVDIWRYPDGRVLRFADGVLLDILK